MAIRANSFSKSSRQKICPSLTTNWSPFCSWWPHATHTKHVTWYTLPSARITNSVEGIVCRHPLHRTPYNLENKNKSECLDNIYKALFQTRSTAPFFRQYLQLPSLNNVYKAFLQRVSTRPVFRKSLQRIRTEIKPGGAMGSSGILVLFSNPGGTYRRPCYVIALLYSVIALCRPIKDGHGKGVQSLLSSYLY